MSVIRVTNELQVMMPYEIKEKMQEPVWLSKDYHICLICYEKPTDFCHRHIVSEWLSENGYKCEEWNE